MEANKKIGIIGCGFSGMMILVHLIREAKMPLDIVMVGDSNTFGRGIAYSAYSDHHLLNVMAQDMGAFPDEKEHFLDWLVNNTEYADFDKKPLRYSFLPRNLYGRYLDSIKAETFDLIKGSGHQVTQSDSHVTDIDMSPDKIKIFTDEGRYELVDYCVIATGNIKPSNIPVANNDIFSNDKYYQNPWKIDSVQNVDSSAPVLILGNGLSMVDTVIGLTEHNFQNTIYTISPNGLTILPHRYNGYGYDKLNDELPAGSSLFDIVYAFNKHIKKIRELGLSSVPLIDSFRPRIQEFWQTFTDEEKKLFNVRLKHLWSAGRHRIPMHIHDRLNLMMIEGKLKTFSGKVNNMVDMGRAIAIEFLNKKSQKTEYLNVGRVINCTGPDTDISRMDDHFLNKCLTKGYISQDALKLGINADPKTYAIIDGSGRRHQHFYTIGSNLRGVLWESTAVNELRQQAKNQAMHLLSLIETAKA